MGTRRATSRQKVRPTTAYPDLVVVRGRNPARNLEAALDRLGGIERFVNKGDTIVVKPNLTWPRKPWYAVTTNPQLVGALVRLCVEAGAADVVVLDHGGGSQEKAFVESGIGRAVRAAGGRIEILRDDDFVDTSIPKGRLLTRWPLARQVLDADVLINVPIAKHHTLARLTMAMKNLMGVMGGDRSIMHTDFAQRIVDLNTRIRPQLVVLDAHRILVRNGPLGGDLADVRRLDTLVVGTDQVAVDAYGTGLFAQRPTDLPYLVRATEQDLGEIELARLSILEEHV